MAQTLQQFREWATAQKSVGNPTSNKANQYVGECVSLIQQYLSRVFGIPYAARGHANMFVPPTFKRIAANSKLQPGDIIAWPGTSSNPYGHIEMIDDDGKALQQNRHGDRKIHRSAIMGGYTAVYRPTKAFIVKTPAPKPKPASKPNTSVPAGHVAQKGTFTANAQSPNIRRKPSTKGNTPVDRLWNGEKVVYDSYIDREGYRWISYIGRSGHRNYIARRTLDNRVIYGTAK